MTKVQYSKSAYFWGPGTQFREIPHFASKQYTLIFIHTKKIWWVNELFGVQMMYILSLLGTKIDLIGQ